MIGGLLFMPKIIGYQEHRTIEGDTFDALALRYYNEEQMASRIIAANPDYCDMLIFEAGVVLRVPVFDSAETPATLPPWRRDA